MSVWKTFKKRWICTDRLKGLCLSIAAFFVITATSSELWIDEEDSFFNLLPRNEIGMIIVGFLIVILFFLYAVDLKQSGDSSTIGNVLATSFFCTALDTLIIFSACSLIFSALFISALERFFAMWELLYVGMPLLIGEFTLSTRTSRKLKEAEKLFEEASEMLDEIKALKKQIKKQEEEDEDLPEIPET